MKTSKEWAEVLAELTSMDSAQKNYRVPILAPVIAQIQADALEHAVEIVEVELDFCAASHYSEKPFVKLETRYNPLTPSAAVLEWQSYIGQWLSWVVVQFGRGYLHGARGCFQ